MSDTSKGLAASLFGFAIPLLALIVTNDPAQAGIIGGAGMVARLLMTLAGGVLADRHRRIALMLLGSLIGIVLAGGFTLLALGDAMTFGSLLVIDVLLAARSGLFDVAGESAIKEIVPDDAMGRAQAANQGRDAALQLAGGPLGGLLLGVGGWLVGAVMTLCHAIAALTAWMLGRQTRRAGVVDAGADDDVAPAPTTKPNAWAELREGFGWLLSRPDLGGVLLITTVINLGFNATITTVIYALQQDGYSELLIGTLSASIGAVMLVGAVCAPLLVPRIKTGILTIAGLSVVSVGAIVLSMVTEPWAIAVVLGRRGPARARAQRRHDGLLHGRHSEPPARSSQQRRRSARHGCDAARSPDRRLRTGLDRTRRHHPDLRRTVPGRGSPRRGQQGAAGTAGRSPLGRACEAVRDGLTPQRCTPAAVRARARRSVPRCRRAGRPGRARERSR